MIQKQLEEQSHELEEASILTDNGLEVQEAEGEGDDTSLDTDDTLLEDNDLVMSDHELSSIVRSLAQDAENYIDVEESPNRVRAAQYYKGRPFGNEEDGRSQVVSRDVRDTIQLMLPQVMRTFFGAESVVEYVPASIEDVALAEQATDYVNKVVFSQDNNGFLEFHAAWKDSLIKGLGVIKVSWEDKDKVEQYQFTGIGEEALLSLIQSEESDALSVEEQEPKNGIPQYNVVLRRHNKNGCVKVEALPTEEFIIDRRAKSVEDALFTGHRRFVTVSDLVELGYDYDEMLAYSETGQENVLSMNGEQIERFPNGLDYGASQEGESNRTVLYIEAYVRVDYDKDGISELRRICCVGNNYEIVSNSVVASTPFVTFTPYPEPHRWVGESVSDITMDLQKIKSNIIRSSLDSLAQSIHPDTAIMESGIVDMDEVLSTRIGKLIRVKSLGAVQELAKSFVGKEAFPMLQYMDEVKESRTGMSKASMGLSPDALQSSTKAAVSATVSASQAQIELLCRVFAETGMKLCFKKILKILHQHQDQSRMVRLRNKWVQVDPRIWDSEMDVSINIALGMGTNEERVAQLTSIADRQSMLLEKYGMENPFVTTKQHAETLKKIVEISGFKDTTMFWSNPEEFTPPQPPPPEPTADEIYAKAQADKVRADMLVDKARLELDREKLYMDDDQKRDALQANLDMKKEELEIKSSQPVQAPQVEDSLMDEQQMMGMVEPQMQPQQQFEPQPQQMENPQYVGQ